MVRGEDPGSQPLTNFVTSPGIYSVFLRTSMKKLDRFSSKIVPPPPNLPIIPVIIQTDKYILNTHKCSSSPSAPV